MITTTTTNHWAVVTKKTAAEGETRAGTRDADVSRVPGMFFPFHCYFTYTDNYLQLNRRHTQTLASKCHRGRLEGKGSWHRLVASPKYFFFFFFFFIFVYIYVLTTLRQWLLLRPPHLPVMTSDNDTTTMTNDGCHVTTAHDDALNTSNDIF